MGAVCNVFVACFFESVQHALRGSLEVRVYTEHRGTCAFQGRLHAVPKQLVQDIYHTLLDVARKLKTGSRFQPRFEHGLSTDDALAMCKLFISKVQ